MTTGQRSPVRTPLSRWWQEARTHYFPRFFFGLCVVAIVVLWRSLTVEPVPANQSILVNSEVSGVVAQIGVSPRQPVKAGDSVAAILASGVGSGRNPVIIEATSDGVITSVFCRTGESIEAGDPIVAILPRLAKLPEPSPAERPDPKKPVLAEVR